MSLVSRTDTSRTTALAAILFAVLLFASTFSSADTAGTITAIGKDSVCVALGDFSSDYTPGELVDILSFGKVAATGRVLRIEPTYMAVIIEKRNPDHFIREGDIIRKPTLQKQKVRSLSAQITPNTPTGIVAVAVEKSPLSEVGAQARDTKADSEKANSADKKEIAETSKKESSAFEIREKPIYDWYAGVPMTSGSAHWKKSSEISSE